jgi:hypothetical protein
VPASPAALRGTDAEEEGGRRGRQGIYRRFLESGNPGGTDGGGISDPVRAPGESGGGVGGGGGGAMSDGGAAARSLPPLHTAFQPLASGAGGGSQQEKDGARWDLAALRGPMNALVAAL